MVRHYKPKGTKNKWTQEQSEGALRDLHAGLGTANSIAKKYGRTTLSDHEKGTSTKRYGGRPTVLTRGEIALTCTSTTWVWADSSYGWPCHKRLSTVRENPFRNSVLGYDCWQGFMKRWPVISERKPEHLSVSRAKAATKQKIDQWFEFLAFHLTDVKIPIQERTKNTEL